MSIHSIPANLDVEKARRLVVRFLRAPSGFVHGDGPEQPPTQLEFTPDLSPAEQATLANIIKAVQSPMELGPDDWQKFSDEKALLQAYHANVTPTNAQSVAAIKALIRVVATLVRDTV